MIWIQPIYRLLIRFCLVLTGTISLVWASTGTDGVLSQLQAEDLRIVHAGEIVYQAHCAACHGATLEGQPNWRSRDANGRLPAPPHDASGHTWHHADDLLFEITKYGPGVVINDPDYNSNMPAYGNVLTDEDIVAVLSFIKNSWPEQERQWQAEVNGNVAGDLLPKAKGSSLLDKLFK